MIMDLKLLGEEQPGQSALLDAIVKLLPKSMDRVSNLDYIMKVRLAVIDLLVSLEKKALHDNILYNNNAKYPQK